MMFNRIEAKFKAKASIRQARPNPMVVTLVFLLLTSLLSTVVERLIFDPGELIRTLLYQYGYQVEEIVPYLLDTYAAKLGILEAVSFVLGIYTTVMNFGYVSYSLRLSRNEDPELSHIFDGFLKLWRVLWMGFLKGLFMGLWGLLGMVPALVVLVVGVMAEMDLYSLMGIYILALVLAILVVVIVGYRYCLAEYFLLDDPGRTARECITLSKKAMKGWKMERFTLDFSFFGWAFLGALFVGGLSQIWYVAGLLGMLAFNAWYLPYRYVTVANFYNHVSGRADPVQKDADWEGRMKELNDAFDKPEF